MSCSIKPATTRPTHPFSSSIFNRLQTLKACVRTRFSANPRQKPRKLRGPAGPVPVVPVVPVVPAKEDSGASPFSPKVWRIKGRFLGRWMWEIVGAFPSWMVPKKNGKTFDFFLLGQHLKLFLDTSEIWLYYMWNKVFITECILSLYGLPYSSLATRTRKRRSLPGPAECKPRRPQHRGYRRQPLWRRLAKWSWWKAESWWFHRSIHSWIASLLIVFVC